MKLLSVEEAARHIAATAIDQPNAFFFLAGSGISYPPIPLAGGIIAECKKRAERWGIREPDALSPMDRYSWWFSNAFHSPGDRQAFLRRLIQGKSISQANLRLAHLLVSRKLTRLVVTPNFDDFLSRALVLFGEQPVVCDHPESILKIDPWDPRELQVVHIHGSYSFYDCQNLSHEIEDRARRPSDSPYSMRGFLDDVLSRRSPLVVGYSGWEKDVFMSSLRVRLQRSLPYNIYWFCYRRESAQDLPAFVREHDNVYVVVPPQAPPNQESKAAEGIRSSGGDPQAPPNQPSQESGGKPTAGTLTSMAVFEELIRVLDLDEPPLVQDPYLYLLGQFEQSAPRDEDGRLDVYFRGVVESLRATVQARSQVRPAPAAAASPAPLESVLSLVRTAKYREAVTQAASLAIEHLPAEELAELHHALKQSARGLLDDSAEELLAYDLIEKTLTRLPELTESQWEDRMGAASDRAITLNNLKRHDEALSAFQGLAASLKQEKRFRSDARLAKALFNVGWTQTRLEKFAEAMETYREAATRFAASEDLEVRRQVAGSMLNLGYCLAQLERSEEAIECYDELIGKFDGESDSSIREQLARGYFNKAYRFSVLKRNEEEIESYRAMMTRFAGAGEAAIQDLLAMGMANLGIALSNAGRREEAVEVYGKLADDLGGVDRLEVGEQVAKGLFNRGVLLGELSRSDEETAAYELLSTLYGKRQEPRIARYVAKAMRNKAVLAGDLGRQQEKIELLDGMIARFQGSGDAEIEEQVARALLGKAIALDKIGEKEKQKAVCAEIVARYGAGEHSAAVADVLSYARRALG